MKRAISILMVIILFTGCSPVFAESKMAIGKDTATTAKENAYTFAYVYLLDPDGFSTDMTDLLYHYTMMYILALATDTAEVKFAAGDGNVSKAEGIDYSRSKAYSSVTYRYPEGPSALRRMTRPFPRICPILLHRRKQPVC